MEKKLEYNETAHQIFREFDEACEVLLCSVIEFGVSMKSLIVKSIKVI
jgi:hypothetical protein